MFSSQPTLTSKLFKAYTGKLAVVVSALVLSAFVWLNPFTATFNNTANAETIDQLPFVIVATSGITDQVEGSVQEGVGTVKRNVGKVTGQTEGALDQAKGDVKQGVGTVKNKLDDAQDNVEDKSESFIDSVKDFFD